MRAFAIFVRDILAIIYTDYELLYVCIIAYFRDFSEQLREKRFGGFFFGFFSSKKWVVKSKNDAERGKFSD